MELSESQKAAILTELNKKMNLTLFDFELDTMLKIIEKHTQSFSKAISSKEEDNLDDPHFKGVAYEKEIDQKALAHGFFKVFFYMAETEWSLDTEISRETGVYIPSVQRYRSYCRSVEWGSHTVERRRRAGCRIFEYRLIPNKESLTWNEYLKSKGL